MTKKYTKKELDFIMKNYKTKSNDEIGKELNLTRDAIRKKLKRLGLKKTNEEIKSNYQNNKHKIAVKGIFHPLYKTHRSEEVKEKIRKKLTGKSAPWNKNNLERYKKEYGSWNKGLPPYMQINWQGGKSYEPYNLDFNKQFKLLIKQRDGFLCLKCGMREEDALILFKRKLNIHHIDYNKHLTIKENCCSLCNRCNGEANFNRISWIRFFQSMLTERYGYQYDLEGNIKLMEKAQ